MNQSKCCGNDKSNLKNEFNIPNNSWNDNEFSKLQKISEMRIKKKELLIIDNIKKETHKIILTNLRIEEIMITSPIAR